MESKQEVKNSISSNMGSLLPLSQTNQILQTDIQPNSSTANSVPIPQENSSNSTESSLPPTPTTSYFNQLKNMPMYPFFPNGNLQPITPTTQSLQSLLSPTSSSNPFFGIMMPQQNSETQSNSSSTTNSLPSVVPFSPTSISNLSNTFSNSTPLTPLPIPVQAKQYFHPHLQPNMPPFGFFTTGPLPTLISNGISSSSSSIEHVANAALSMTSGNPGKTVKGSKPVMFRNLFHTINVRFLMDTPEFEQCRIYVDESVAYSGNAKRYKKTPDKEEKALRLNMQVFDANNKPISQCLQCRDYFEHQKYFKANSDCMGKFVLVKSNSPIKIENGSFKILAKMMCCCQHHSADGFNVVITCSSQNTSSSSHFIARLNVNVKQWRKSNQKKEEMQFVLSPTM